MTNAPTASLPRLSHRHPRRRRVGLLSSGSVGASLGDFAAAGHTPNLAMPEPEDRRSALIAGSLTTLLHGLVLGILVLLAWLAPPVEQLIEVRIIRELPGSDAEPAPARKIIQPRARPRTVQTAARRVTPQAVAQPRMMNVAPQQLNLNALKQAAAPQAVQRRQVVSQRTQARSIDQRRVASDLDLSKLRDVAVVPTDLEAPVVDTDGPRQIDPGAAVQAPQNFAVVPPVDDVDYASAAPVEVVSDQDLSPDTGSWDFDTDVGVYAGGAGTGGTGTAVGVVRCFESAYVNRYLDVVKQRTEKRWQVPAGVPDNAQVKLRFVLDSSGAATQVEFVGETEAALGNSAVAALRAASPFPPMDDNVRCLAGKKLSGTFSVENL